MDARTNADVRTVMDIEAVEHWPENLLTYLSTNYDLFLNWEIATGRRDAARYDRAIDGLIDTLRPYALVGWHCTRLTDREIETIVSGGMQLPDATMLRQRVDALEDEGLVETAIAARFRSQNQAHEPNRAGKIWFCFFPPHLAGENGVGRLLRFWGGEALYNSHHRQPETSKILRGIGTPSIVEAAVPIAFLGSPAGLAFKVVRRYLISRRYDTHEPCDHEGNITQPLPASYIQRVISFPQPDFLELSGCESWREPLTS